MNTDLGTLIRTDDGRYALRYERHYPHPIESVWAAITVPARVSSWFPADVDIELREGAKLEFVFRAGEGSTIGGEVRRIDPPHLLELRWGEEILRYELAADGAGGCQFVFTNIFDDRSKAARDGAGWHACLDVLAVRLMGDEPPWQANERWAQVHDDYVRAFAP